MPSLRLRKNDFIDISLIFFGKFDMSLIKLQKKNMYMMLSCH
jgi:hypothetical protein